MLSTHVSLPSATVSSSISTNSHQATACNNQARPSHHMVMPGGAHSQADGPLGWSQVSTQLPRPAANIADHYQNHHHAVDNPHVTASGTCGGMLVASAAASRCNAGAAETPMQLLVDPDNASKLPGRQHGNQDVNNETITEYEAQQQPVPNTQQQQHVSSMQVEEQQQQHIPLGEGVSSALSDTQADESDNKVHHATTQLQGSHEPDVFDAYPDDARPQGDACCAQQASASADPDQTCAEAHVHQHTRHNKQKRSKQQAPPRPTHFLAMRVSSSERVISCIQQVQTALVEQSPQLKHCLLEPITAHMTLLVMCLAGEQQLQAAKDCLRLLGGALHEQQLDGAIQLHLQGLSNFRGQVGQIRPLSDSDST